MPVGQPLQNLQPLAVVDQTMQPTQASLWLRPQALSYRSWARHGR
jgi:hypothetical protein